MIPKYLKQKFVYSGWFLNFKIIDRDHVVS
jgi:hypothetical protein